MALWDLANADVHRGHGLQHGGEPPGRVPLRDAGAAARRDGDPRRSAFHPHLGAGQYPCADPLGHRHRVPRWHDPTTSCKRTSGSSEFARRLHQHRHHHRRRLRRCRRTTTACSPASRPKDGSYKQDTWQYKGEVVPPRSPSITRRHRGDRRRRAEDVGTSAARRSDPAAPELRLSDHAAPLCALHAGDGGARHRLPAGDVLADLRGDRRRIPGAIAPGRSVTRSAGRTTPSACRSFAPLRSSRACSGNIGRPGRRHHGAARAYAASRAARTSRRCTTCCRPTCRSPNACSPHHTLKQFLENRNRPDRLVEQPAEIHGQSAEGLVRPDCARRTTSSATSYLPKLTGDHSQLPMTLAMADGVVKGQFVLGQNPVVGGANSDLIERGLSRTGMARGA